MARLYIPDILKLSDELLAAWDLIDPQLHLGGLTREAVAEQLAELRRTEDNIRELEAQMIAQRNHRDDQADALREVIKRGRSLVKGLYGDDSSQYELIGGTRRSDRRRPVRRTRS